MSVQNIWTNRMIKIFNRRRQNLFFRYQKRLNLNKAKLFKYGAITCFVGIIFFTVSMIFIFAIY